MNIEIRTHDGVTVVTPQSAELNYANLTEFKAEMHGLMDKGAQRIALDMHNVTALDSAGVGALISLRGRLVQERGTMALANLSDHLTHVMDVDALNKVFDIYDSVDKAVSMLQLPVIKNSSSFELRGETIWVELTGEVTMDNVPDMKRKIDKFMARKDFAVVVIQLAQVTFMDSSGISFLVLIHKRCKEYGKQMHLLRPSPEVTKVLDLVGLSKLFSIRDSEEDLG